MSDLKKQKQTFFFILTWIVRQTHLDKASLTKYVPFSSIYLYSSAESEANIKLILVHKNPWSVINSALHDSSRQRSEEKPPDEENNCRGGRRLPFIFIF